MSTEIGSHSSYKTFLLKLMYMVFNSIVCHVDMGRYFFTSGCRMNAYIFQYGKLRLGQSLGSSLGSNLFN